MPVYEYFCTDCRTKFDALRRMAQADDAIVCEVCGGAHTARVLSVFAVKGGDGATVMQPAAGGCGCGGACACGGR
ncbi:MAG TPA: zinc ribbon domain-containing protein [Anaerolineae bacterium]|nr:zinc ribbon domain-containing protein [Anaerolineae bacterium]